MLILLPPSEGKNTPARTRPYDPQTLSHAELAAAREQVLTTLQRVSAQPDATSRLGVGASLVEQVTANTTLHRAPAAPAAQVYSGVLYEAAGLAQLSGTARRRANASVRIISALWGVLRPDDRIPAYRLSMTAALPALPKLSAFWAAHLPGVLDPDGSDVVVDCRSGAYAPAWSPPPEREWVTVRVVALRDGEPQVVSHHAKHTRGLLVDHLLRRSEPLPRTVGQVRAAAEQLIGTIAQQVSLQPATAKGPDILEIVLAD